MRLNNFILFLLLLLLVAGQLNTLSHARSVSRESEYSAPAMAYFRKISPSQELGGGGGGGDEFSSSSIYGASKRMVPQGPNPLHN